MPESERVAGDALGEIVVDRSDQQAAMCVAPGIGGQMLLIVGIARKPSSSSTEGHVRGLQHPKPGRSAVSAYAAALPASSPTMERANDRRAVLRLALGKIDQDIGHHLVGIARQLDAGEGIGEILLGRERLRLFVGGLLRQACRRWRRSPCRSAWENSRRGSRGTGPRPFFCANSTRSRSGRKVSSSRVR